MPEMSPPHIGSQSCVFLSCTTLRQLNSITVSSHPVISGFTSTVIASKDALKKGKKTPRAKSAVSLLVLVLPLKTSLVQAGPPAPKSTGSEE